MSASEPLVLTATGLRTLIGAVIGNTQDETAELVRLREQLAGRERRISMLERDNAGVDRLLHRVYVHYHTALLQCHELLVKRRFNKLNLPAPPLEIWNAGTKEYEADKAIPF